MLHTRLATSGSSNSYIVRKNTPKLCSLMLAAWASAAANPGDARTSATARSSFARRAHSSAQRCTVTLVRSLNAKTPASVLYARHAI